MKQLKTKHCTVSDIQHIPPVLIQIRPQHLVGFPISFTNAMENALLARENDMATPLIRLNKKSHIREDRLLALNLLVRQIKDQSIGIRYTRNVLYGLLCEIHQQRDKQW